MFRSLHQYFLLITIVLSACGTKTTDQQAPEEFRDSLAIFPINSSLKFVSSNTSDQIAVLLNRDSANTITYRIELLRKWKGLPHSYGKMQLQRLEDDSVYVFKGRDTDCDVVMKIYNTGDKLEYGKSYLALERNCQNDSLDIAFDEFKRLVHK